MAKDQPTEGRQEEFQKGLESGGLRWLPSCRTSERNRLTLAALATLSYLEKLDLSKRPEEINNEILFGPIWDVVNDHLGTQAQSFPELIEQLGILRFGHRPRIGDTFCGGGSIPFEAARLGCDVYASDLNPIACMLTWGALKIVGGLPDAPGRIAKTQDSIATTIDREITSLGIEHDERGNRAKAYLWCLETKCPQTGWMIPIAPSWVTSKNSRICARLVPDHARKRFKIEIVTDATLEQMELASLGTQRDNDLVYELDGEIYNTPLATIRGDYCTPEGRSANRLRRWERRDVSPQPDDIFQERLYCIQWIKKGTENDFRPKLFFAAPTDADLRREQQLADLVRKNLDAWQEQGLVPDLPIEPLIFGHNFFQT